MILPDILKFELRCLQCQKSKLHNCTSRVHHGGTKSQESLMVDLFEASAEVVKVLTVQSVVWKRKEMTGQGKKQHYLSG